MAKGNDYIVIQDWMVDTLGLSGTRLLVYAIIYGFTKSGAGCFTGSAQYFMRWTGVSRATVFRIIQGFVRDGLVVRRELQTEKGRKRELVAIAPAEDSLMVRLAESHGETEQSHGETSGGLMVRPHKYSDKTSSDNTRDKDSFDQAIAEVVAYLNTKAGKQFRPTTPKTQSLIRSLLKDGFTVEDMKHVIDVKVPQWLGDSKMDEYLRPKTLFNRTNFENYLNQQGGVSSGLRSKYE